MTVIDVAGGPTGGAARWRYEAECWLARVHSEDVRLIGRTERVSLQWLARREFIGRPESRIAANNVSFVTGKAERTVILRNPLHFLLDHEEESIPSLPGHLRRQTPIVRACARLADRVVVPSTHMAERVRTAVPTLGDRLIVRHHPLSPRFASTPNALNPYILYPSIPSPHKDLQSGLECLLAGVTRSGLSVRVKATAEPRDLPRFAGHPQLDLVGTQTLSEIDNLWAQASIGFIPYTVESFCYPLAEARAAGIPVIARNTQHNREIAGDSLVGFELNSPDDLATALADAMSHKPDPDPTPFEPDAYFSWLVAGG